MVDWDTVTYMSRKDLGEWCSIEKKSSSVQDDALCNCCIDVFQRCH
jgi:hypothetical protein